MEIGATYRIYESISIEENIYMYIHIYFTIKIYIQNFYVVVDAYCGVHSTTLYLRIATKVIQERMK